MERTTKPRPVGRPRTRPADFGNARVPHGRHDSFLNSETTMALYQLRRYTPDLPTEGKYEIIRTGPSRESLSDLLDHYLAGPDGPVVGSRYADYRIVVTRIDDAEDDIDAAIADAERQVLWSACN